VTSSPWNKIQRHTPCYQVFSEPLNCKKGIDDVCEVQEEAFERPPETLNGVARDLIRGAYKLRNRLLLVLDTEKAVQMTG
jgi:hypothetical protein